MRLQYLLYFTLKSNYYVKCFQRAKCEILKQKSFRILKKYYIKSARIDRRLAEKALV
jgi:hypothetical protein